MNGISTVQRIANRAYDREGAEAYQRMMEHLTTLNGPGSSRLSRAEGLLEDGKVRHVQGTPWYEVLGSKGQVYKVKASNGSASCECVDFTANSLPCKHVLACAMVEDFLSDSNPDLHLREIAQSLYGYKRRPRGSRQQLASVLPVWIGKVLVKGRRADSGAAILHSRPAGRDKLSTE